MHGSLLVSFSEDGAVKLPIILYLSFMDFLLQAQPCEELGNSKEMLRVFEVYKKQWNWRSLTGLCCRIKSDPQWAMGFQFVKLNTVCLILVALKVHR